MVAVQYFLAMLQVLQNKAARCVTRLPWMTPTSVLLAQCGWLSLKQLVLYHSMVMLFKTKKDKAPVYIYDHIGDTPGRNTRQEADRIEANLLKATGSLEQELQGRHSFLDILKTGTIYLWK